jgi:sigma-B regulation protein RsbU (phosphoserine phosphatase)
VIDDWQARLDRVVEMMREVSMQTEPQDMVAAYTKHMRVLRPVTGFVSLSRRGLQEPYYRIARSHVWEDQPNPWKERERLPVLKGGLMGELAYADQPVIIDDLQIAADDPCAEHFAGQRSLIALPVFDNGIALNIVIQMRDVPAGFDRERLPELVWTTNLFGRGTHNLVLSQQLREAHAALDAELKTVANIQRIMLPERLPAIRNMQLAVHYETSQRAGGDYYDVFELPDDRVGILVADVSGHGTPAAVLMAITHAIAHLTPEPPTDPAAMLTFLNGQLAEKYATRSHTFVTAVYGVYDPATREFRYANAGHPPPRLKHCDDGSLAVLQAPRHPPLGVVPDLAYEVASQTLRPGDQLVFYTDGITEARDAAGEFFGPQRIDECLENCHLDAQGLIDTLIERLRAFAGTRPLDDDTTLLVAKVS